MQAAEQKTEQPILSRELKVDKKLELSNGIDRPDGGFKEIIANSIRPIKINSPRDKFNALKESISYPNNYVFASLANRIYQGEKRNSTGQYSHGEAVPGLGNWRLLTVAERSGGLVKTILNAPINAITQGSTSGYFGAAYWNSDTQQVIIVHSGTKNFGGGVADLNGVLLNQHVYQIDSAITFTDKIISVLKEINEDNKKEGKQVPYIQLFITGHSLGAWLAPITAFSAKYLVKKGDCFVASTNFEETGYHASTVIFDPPGCEEMLRRIQSRLMDRYSPSRINSLDVTTYLSAPNLINACNPQVGEVYRLFVDLSGREKQDLWSNVKDWFDININYTRFTHSIEKIKGMFDPETGEVLKDKSGQLRIKKVRDWPLLISGDEKATTRNKAFWVAKWAVRVVTHSVPIAGLLTDIGEGTYAAGSFIKWHVEFKGELNNFFELANKSNDFHLNDKDTHLKTGGRKIRYRTQKLNENYKNERSFNAFTRLERQFLETYKLLDSHQKELPDEFKFKNLFSSLGHNQELKRKTMEMLEGCTIKNGVIHSKNLQEFIPYIKRMLHFFPEMKSEVEKAQQSLPIHILSTFYQSASSSYVKSIKDSLEFENDNLKLGDFFKSNELKILHIVQSNTSLEATRVYETFKMVENCYRNSEYHGFFSLDRISYLGDSLFIGFLKKVKNKYLLVVECDSDEAKEFLEKLFSTLQDNHNIKVILVTEKGSDLSKFVSEHIVNNPSKCREENSEVKWNDLTSDSQRKLLEKTVIFQGKEVPLSRVVSGNDALDAIIDPETIAELFKNKKIEIGKPLPSLGETEGYYIDRELVKKVKVKEEVLKDDNLTDLFAVSNISKEELSALVNGGRVRDFGDEDPDRSSPIRFITLSENAGENFNNLCNRYSDCTIHLLERKNNGDLIWRKSHGKTLSGLRRYIENYESDLPDDAYSRNNTSIKMVNVNDISNFDERLIVVAAEPGMGKTTALTRFGTQKADDSSKWLIRINLVEYKDKLEQADFSSVGSIVEFLHENNIVSNTLAKKLLESRLNNSGNIVFLLDGFDEITSKGQTNVVNLIKKLQENEVEKVLISTRLHLRNELENSLSTVAYTLKPFSREDQAEFLEKFWQRPNIDTEGRLDNYINELLEFISKSIGDKERRFMGIPMQMRMVAEAFREGLENQLNQQEPTFPENFDMIKLYDRFLHAKYRVYFGKRGAENIDLDDEDEDWITVKPTKVHRSLALKVLFPEMEKDFIGDNLPSEKDKQRVNRVGIAQCINDRVVFTHRTFAEYFVAGFLADKLSRGKNSKKYETIIEFLAKELFENKNEVIKTFLDYRLAKEEIHAAILKGKLNDMLLRGGTNVNVTDVLGRSALHYAAQEGYKEIVDNLLKKGANIRKSDELGKTALHYAARYNDGTEVVSYLLENAKDCINNKDKNGHTAVYYAAQQGNWDIVDRILTEKVASVEGLDAEKLLFHYTYKGSLDIIKNIVKKEKINVTAIKDNHDNTLLHIAAQKGHLTVVEFLLEKGADVGVTNNSGKRPISYAAEGNHWNIVESLLRKKAEFNHLSVPQKFSLLNHSAQNAHWEIVKLFMEDNGRDYYFGRLSDQQRVGLLCYLIRSKDLDIAEFLIARGTEVNNSDEHGKKPIHYAAENGHWRVVELLLRKRADLNDLNKKQKLSLLCYSAQNFQWDVVKMFMKDNTPKNNNSVSVNWLLDITGLSMSRSYYFDCINDQQRMYFLYYLISSGSSDIIRFFIEKLIEKKKISGVNTPNNCGKTFLHLAAQDGKLDIAQYLVDEKGANINAATNRGLTPLHLAARNGHSEIVKYFVDKGADLTVKNTDGRTPKDLATEKGYTDIVRFLEKSQQDRLIDAAKQGDLNMVKKLIDQGTNFKFTNESGFTPLHYAASRGHLEVVQYLVDKGADINCATYIDFVGRLVSGRTPLHWAARSGKLEVVKYLVAKGADINCRDTHDSTPLDLAVMKRGNPVTLFLKEQGAKFRSDDLRCTIQLCQKQQRGFLDLSQFISNNFQNASIQPVKQGLYLPSFEARNVKIDGKCVAITRGLSQALLLQGGKSFLNNLET
ncbi:ankyrin-3, partial [Trichonephila clavipes]